MWEAAEEGGDGCGLRERKPRAGCTGRREVERTTVWGKDSDPDWHLVKLRA